jgi:hypothetical protein
MAPAFAIPLLLARPGLTYADIDIWEVVFSLMCKNAAE